MASGLHVRLLGQPLITYAGEPLTLSRRRLRTLLYYLAVEREPQTREHLGTLLWEDLPESLIRKNLRELLSRLRKELPDQTVLQTGKEYIALNPERCTTDVHQFLNLYDQAAAVFSRVPSGIALPPGGVEVIQQALSVWEGTRFTYLKDLEGSVGLESWNNRLGMRVNNARLELLDRLAEYQSLTGNHPAALASLRQALDLEPTDDRLSGRLLRLAALSGQPAELAGACRLVQHNYRQAGLNLPEELEELCRQAGRSRRRAGGSRPVNPHSSLRMSLAGGTELLSEMNAAVLSLRPVILFGAPGSGKTRLLQELNTRTQGVRRLVAIRGQRQSQALPLEPFLEYLRSDLTGDDWQLISPEDRQTLGLVIPAAGPAAAHPPAPEQPLPFSRTLLIQALMGAFKTLAGNTPTLLVVDNAQWLDESSVHLLESWQQSGALRDSLSLVLSLRQEELRGDLRNLINQLENQNSALTLHIQPLDEKAVFRMAIEALGRQITPAFASRLYRDTGGNPLHVLETLRLVLASPDEELERLSRGNLPIARSVQALINERLQQLSPAASTLLGLAAAMGMQFSLHTLEKAGRRSAEDTMRLLEELERAQMIRTEPGGQGGFQQDQVREWVLQGMSASRRRFMHLRIAHALEDSVSAGPGPQSAQLARIYQEAGEDELACRSWLNAAHYALRLFAVREAMAAFGEAERLVNTVPTLPKHLLLELYSSLGVMGEMTRDPALIGRVSSRLTQAGWERSDHELVAAGLLGKVQAHLLAGEEQECLDMLQTAKFHLEQHPDPHGWTIFHYRKGIVHAQMHQLGQALTDLEQALTVGSQPAHHPQARMLRITINLKIAELAIYQGSPERSHRAAQQALLDSRVVLDRLLACHALNSLGMSAFVLGKLNDSRRFTGEAEEMIQPLHARPLRDFIDINLAQLALLDGDLGGAWTFTGRILEDPHTVVASPALRLRADCLRLLGQPEAALALYEEAQERNSNPWFGYSLGYRKALVLACLGETEQALAELELARERAQRANADLYHWHTASALAMVLLKTGQEEEALRLSADCAEKAGNEGMPYLRANHLVLMTHHRTAGGDRAGAAAAAADLVHLTRRLGSAWMELGGLALLRRSGGDDPESRARLDFLVREMENHAADGVLKEYVRGFMARLDSAVGIECLSGWFLP